MRVMIREASTARNLEALLPLVTPANARRCCFVTDDRHPHDLIDEGHIDFAVRKAIRLGLDPMTAYRMASLNTAEWFQLDRQGFGAIAPGSRADLLVLDDLEAVSVERVYVGGILAARNGELVGDVPEAPSSLPPSVRIDLARFSGFGIAAQGSRVHVIDVIPDQIVTGRSIEQARVENGEAVADVERDLLKIAVVERHGRGGGVGLGFVRGLGLQRGAIASSVAHDSHNIVIAGADDASMRHALEVLVQLQGGLVVTDGDATLASLPLPIAGLMSDRPLHEVRDGLDRLEEAYRALGGNLAAPFMALSFLALAVIPSLKITDKGLVDVDAFELVSLWASPRRAPKSTPPPCSASRWFLPPGPPPAPAPPARSPLIGPSEQRSARTPRAWPRWRFRASPTGRSRDPAARASLHSKCCPRRSPDPGSAPQMPDR
jgi:adenine deaminase